MRAFIDLAAGRASVASIYRSGDLTVEGLSQFDGSEFFAYALLTVEQIGVRDTAVAKGLFKYMFGPVLAQNTRK
jgi:hypothetical protein